MKPQGFVPPSNPAPDHEGADLNIPLVVQTAAILASILVVLLVAVGALFHYLNDVYPHRTSHAAPVVATADLPPAPRLQTDPAGDLQAVRAREDAHLTRYAWIDRAQNIAQIPIDRAMVLWVKNYTPAPDATFGTNAPAATTELQMRQDKAKEAMHAP